MTAAYPDQAPRQIDGKQVGLWGKLDPPIIVANQSPQQDTLLQFRLFDVNTNATIPHVTYLVQITKPFDNESRSPLMTESFHSHNGILILRMQPKETSEGEDVTVEGKREPALNAWIGSGDDGIVNIKSSLFSHAAMYHCHIEVLSAIDDTNKLSKQEAPTFNLWLSRGEAINEDIIYNGQSYNSTVISYFDRMSNFDFDSNSKTISWSVPFDWNSTKIQNNGQGIFVHQEIIVPKVLFNSSSEVPLVSKVNGLVLTARSLAVEPYRYNDKTVFHFLLNTQDLINMTNAIPKPTPSEMTFTLSQDNDANIPEFEGSSLMIAIGASISVIVIFARFRIARFEQR